MALIGSPFVGSASCRDPMTDTAHTVQAHDLPFASIYRHGFVRVAAAVPQVTVADPRRQRGADDRACRRRRGRWRRASSSSRSSGLSAYTGEDLFRQDALLEETEGALARVLAASAGSGPVIVVGMPVRAEQGLFNAAIVLQRGRILGAVPKSYLPEYREYYEKRQFRAARDLIGDSLRSLGETVPFGADLAVRR